MITALTKSSNCDSNSSIAMAISSSFTASFRYFTIAFVNFGTSLNSSAASTISKKLAILISRNFGVQPDIAFSCFKDSTLRALKFMPVSRRNSALNSLTSHLSLSRLPTTRSRPGLSNPAGTLATTSSKLMILKILVYAWVYCLEPGAAKV